MSVSAPKGFLFYLLLVVGLAGPLWWWRFPLQLIGWIGDAVMVWGFLQNDSVRSALHDATDVLAPWSGPLLTAGLILLAIWLWWREQPLEIVTTNVAAGPNPVTDNWQPGERKVFARKRARALVRAGAARPLQELRIRSPLYLRSLAGGTDGREIRKANTDVVESLRVVYQSCKPAWQFAYDCFIEQRFGKPRSNQREGYQLFHDALNADLLDGLRRDIATIDAGLNVRGPMGEEALRKTLVACHDASGKYHRIVQQIARMAPVFFDGLLSSGAYKEVYESHTNYLREMEKVAARQDPVARVTGYLEVMKKHPLPDPIPLPYAPILEAQYQSGLVRWDASKQPTETNLDTGETTYRLRIKVHPLQPVPQPCEMRLAFAKPVEADGWPILFDEEKADLWGVKSIGEQDGWQPDWYILDDDKRTIWVAFSSPPFREGLSLTATVLSKEPLLESDCQVTVATQPIPYTSTSQTQPDE